VGEVYASSFRPKSIVALSLTFSIFTFVSPKIKGKEERGEGKEKEEGERRRTKVRGWAGYPASRCLSGISSARRSFLLLNSLLFFNFHERGKRKKGEKKREKKEERKGD